MFINKSLNCDMSVRIVVRNTTKVRLATTCFRDSRVPLSGEFIFWKSVDDVLGDELVMTELLQDISTAFDQKAFGTNSVSITHRELVGWDSTAPITDFRPDDLEKFQPNRRSAALRVKLGNHKYLARKTKTLTIVYELKREVKDFFAIVHSMYPGEDIGELEGNVTEREQRVFFDFNHPGQD